METDSNFDKFADEIVFVTKGKHKGRIGYCDDYAEDTLCIVYFGSLLIILHKDVLIPEEYLRLATTDDYVKRLIDIFQILFEGKATTKMRITLLEEYIFISEKLTENMIKARFLRDGNPRKIFISHSSQDNWFARRLATDLSNAGHFPWLDDWEIFVGDSIPNKISVGITDCEFVIVILSKHSVKSNWVEREWQTKYWDEVQSGNVRVIPILLEECEIPSLLQTKKYANFTQDYAHGLNEILLALNKNTNNK